MNFKNTNIITKLVQSYVPITLISIYAFFINWISANMGVMVIDTFSFFDSSFNRSSPHAAKVNSPEAMVDKRFSWFIVFRSRLQSD